MKDINLEENENTKLHNNGAFTYSKALEIIGTGRFHIVALLLCGLCLMSVVNETLNMGFIISPAECDLNLSYRDKGMLNGAAFLGIVISSHFWGYISDTKGRRKVMLISCGGSFLFSVLSSFSQNFWMLITTRFLVGFFISGNASTSYAYLAEFHSDKSRAKAISLAASFMALGMTALPALAWIIIPLESKITINIPLIEMKYNMWRLYIVLCSLLEAVVFICLLYMPESSKFTLMQGDNEKAIEILKKVYKWNTHNSDESFPIEELSLDDIDLNYVNAVKNNSMSFRHVWDQTAPLFKTPLLSNTLKASFLMFSLFASSSGLFMWTPDILNHYIKHINDKMTICEILKQKLQTKESNGTGIESNNLTTNECNVEVDATIFMITFLMGIIFSLCYAINGLVINQIGKKNLLNCWFGFCGACGIVLVWTNNFYTTLVFLVGFLAAGVCGSVLSAISVDLFPTNYRSMALCLILMAGRGGAMIGSNLIAILLTYNCTSIFVVFGGLLIVCTVIGATIPGK